MPVLLAMPCYGAMMHVGGARTLLRSGPYVDDYLITSGESAITRGRSNMLPTFLKTNCDRLLMIDADCELDSAGIEALVNSDKDVIGAAVSMKTADFSESLTVFRGRQRLRRENMPQHAVFEVDFMGGAVMCVHRRVIEALCDAYPDLAYEDAVVGKSVHLFHEIVRDNWLRSEDFAFCERIREQGFKIHCDSSIMVGHWEGRCCWKF